MLKGSGVGFQVPITGFALILALTGVVVLAAFFIGTQGRIVQSEVRSSLDRLVATDAAHALERCLAGAGGVIPEAALEQYQGTEAEDLLLERCGVRVGRDYGVTESGLSLGARVVDLWAGKEWDFDYNEDGEGHALFVAIRAADGVHLGRLYVQAEA